MKFKKISPKLRSIIFLAVFLLGDLFVLTFIIHKAVKEIYTLNQAINQERAKLEEKYQKRKSARLTVENFNKIRKELPNLETSVIHAGDELNLVTSLEEAASKNNISQKINLSPRENKKDFGDRINITLNIDGSFQDFLRYLNDIERMKIMLIVDNINISQATREDERQTGKIRALLQGHLYFSKN